jgi:hypothetical protein
LYALCFITLLIALFAFVGLVTNIVELIYAPPGIPGIPEQEPRYYTTISIVRNAVTLLLAVPIYLYHWRKIQEERVVETEEG